MYKKHIQNKILQSLFWLILLLMPSAKLFTQETVTQFFSRAEAAYEKIKDYKAIWRMNIGGQNSVATVYYKTPRQCFSKLQ